MEKEKYPLKEVWIRLEEGRTLYSSEPVSNAQTAVEIMQAELSRYDREVVCIVTLNTRKQPINFNMVSMGTINTSIVDIANVLKTCILSNAESFIMLHNHPSGDPTPSDLDIKATERMILAGLLIGVPCIDHVIIAGNRKEIHSMREHQDAEFEPGYDQVMEGSKSMVAEGSAAYQTPFGDIDEEALMAAQAAGAPQAKREEVTVHFGKGLCQFFTSKKGEEMARIKIPNTPFDAWPSFVVPARIVHDNRFGKGYWMKLPADGKTTLSIPKRVVLDDGTEGWRDKRISINNTKLKEMVESYRRETQTAFSEDPDPSHERPKEHAR